MEKDYSKLEGKVIKIFGYEGAGIHEGIVTGCDPDIGISIMDLSKIKYMYCLNGPSTVQFREIVKNRGNKLSSEQDLVSALFEKVVGCIEAGEFDLPGHLEWSKTTTDGTAGHASVDSCSFT